MTDTRTLVEIVARHLLLAIDEGSLGPGQAADLSRRIVDEALQRGVETDSLLEPNGLASRL